MNGRKGKYLPWLFGLCACIALAGCGIIPMFQGGPSPEMVQQTIQALSTQYTPDVPDSSTPTLFASPAPTMTPSPSSFPTQEIVICRDIEGEIEFREIIIPESNQTLAFRIYLPPCYAVDTSIEYPVLYLLHGQSKKDDQWDRLGADEHANQLIASGEISPLIIVMPWEVNNLIDPAESDFGDNLVEYLLPWVDKEYRTCENRDCRAIGGISRGGGWAVRLGFTEWEHFSAIGAHSFAPFAGDFYNAPYWFQEIPGDELPRVYMDFGALDALLDTARLFEDRLTKYQVPHEWIINRGTHNETYWSEHMLDYLYWYSFPWQNKDTEQQAWQFEPATIPSVTNEEVLP